MEGVSFSSQPDTPGRRDPQGIVSRLACGHVCGIFLTADISGPGSLWAVPVLGRGLGSYKVTSRANLKEPGYKQLSAMPRFLKDKTMVCET